MTHTRFAAALFLLATASAAPAQTTGKTVDVKAPDGLSLKGTYYAPGKPGPAMLLLHQCNMDRHAWDGLAADLSAAGFHVLTVDYRGYGDSGGERLTDPAARRTQQQEKWPGDVDAAYAFLLAQPGVDKQRVVAGGASCGVTQASDLAARHHEIRALMLLSGSASDSARAYFTAAPSLAIFGSASEGDKNAAEGIRAAVAASKHPKSELKMFDGTEHGVPMFPKHPDLMPGIVGWLKARVAGGTS